MGHSASPVLVLPPTFEQHHDGFGVQCVHPRVSWRFSCSNEQIRNWKQTAYDIAITYNSTEPDQVFHVESEDNVLVPWPNPEPLDSRERRLVRVRCYGKYSLIADGRDEASDHESVTEWSASSLLEIALLRNSDWKGSMITVSEPWPLGPDHSARPLRFHKRFHLSLKDGTIDRGRLYATSHGVYSVRINGREVGDHCLAPGFQSYHKRLHYQLYDTEDLLVTPGWNTIEIDVAAGWFASATSWARKRFVYGQKLGVLAQLEVWATDSNLPISVSTDPSWSVSNTPLVSSEILDGEIFDQSLVGSKLDDAKFSVRESPVAVSRLISPEAPPVRVVERLEAKDMFKSRSRSAVIVDFGQNIAGRICVRRVQKPAGSRITLRHAEVIQDGEIMCRPLRTAKARDIIICDGRELLDWHPHHTFHGFRYVEIAGWGPDDQICPLTKASIVAEVMHTDMLRTGWFSCSNDDVNRLHENSLHSIKSNFLSIPTECPSRDERFGWTGDLSIIAPTANFLYDTAGMLRHWLQDLYLDQMEETEYWHQGVVPLFIPNSLLRNGDGGHGWDPMPNGVWGDAAVMVPWGLYRMSGDVSFLSAQYDSMVQHLENGVIRGPDGLWDPELWQFGDWLDPRAPQNDSGRGTTDGTFVADCFLVASTQVAAEVAAKLAKPVDSPRFRDAALRLVHAWRDKYLTAAGLVVPDTATALSLALSFDLLLECGDNSAKAQAAARLFRLVRLNDFKLTTGFVGSAFLSQALTRSGGVDLSYAMLFQKKCPSYLYPITMGATTTWERWDSMLPDGTVNPGSMTSFNHHALGSIANWMHADIGGLEAIEPGWKVFRVKPQPNKELSWANTMFESRYGRIDLRWTLKGDLFRMRLRVPPNSTAVVSLPSDGRESEVGKREAKEQRVGSGEYHLECRFVQAQWPPKALLPPWGRSEF